MNSFFNKNSNQVLYDEALVLANQKSYCAAERKLQALLTDETNNADVFMLLAFVKKNQRLYKEQIIYLKKALTLIPDSCNALVELAFAHYYLNQYAKAKQLANIALRGSGDKSVETYKQIATLFHALGLYSLAKELLQEAVDKGMQDQGACYLLAESYALCGQVDEAKQLHTKLIQADPNSINDYIGLSKVRKATKENNNIAELQDLLKQNRNPWFAINIYHSLSKELDDIGNYQEAYRVLALGKKRLCSVSPYAPYNSVKNIADLHSLYAKHLNDILKAKTDIADAPIFVVGMPRTGTTIVERLLSNHESVVSVGERLQLSTLLKRQCDASYSGLIDAEALAASWSKIDFDTLGYDYIESVNYLSGANRFVDKLPLNILLVGVILRALPKAKIICLSRNPLDTIIGNYRQIFEYSSGTYTHTLGLPELTDFFMEFKKLSAFFQQQFPENFMIMNYESLVSTPEEAAKTLFNFCELTWQKNYLNIHENKAQIGTASAAQVQEPIHQRAIGKSKNYMFCLKKVEHYLNEINHGDLS